MKKEILFFMNNLIISSFSNIFEELKNDKTLLFLNEICNEFVIAYKFVKINDHKSHLLMIFTDLEQLGEDMEFTFATGWDKKIIARIP